LRSISFWKAQIYQLREGGAKVLIAKVLFVSETLFLYLLALFALGVVRLLRPIKCIRVAPLVSDRIGHYAGNTELYLCERDAGMHDGCFDLFYHRGRVCNEQMKVMWSRILRTFPHSRFFDYFIRLNSVIPGGKAHKIQTSDRDVLGLMAESEPHLIFSPIEQDIGERGLREMGIPQEKDFICFLSRTSSYLKSVYPQQDWAYHDYRDSSIYNYIPAVENLVQRGYSAIRMGATQEETIDVDNAGIIDYANGSRTELLDLYLASKCSFSLAGSSGFEAVPLIFRRPRAIVNHIPLIHIPYWNPSDLIIFKKLWLREEKRFLSFCEMIESVVGGSLMSNDYEMAGIEVVENTAEEIEALVIEMDERLKGSWQSEEEDEKIQRDFWALLEHIEPGKRVHARIGTEFLQCNKGLLYQSV